MVLYKMGMAGLIQDTWDTGEKCGKNFGQFKVDQTMCTNEVQKTNGCASGQQQNDSKKNDSKVDSFVEDKTSDLYVPKTYRHQNSISLFLTWVLKKCGITFLQPIKWKNVLMIVGGHLLFLYSIMIFPVFEVYVKTILWGK